MVYVNQYLINIGIWQTVLCMHVYTYDVYFYTIAYLLTNIIVICLL